MDYIATKHQRNSLRITTLIALLIFLLLFFVGPQYLDPPEEYGVAVNFGNSDSGSGISPLAQPEKANQNVPEPTPKPLVTASKTSDTKAEDVLTQDHTDAMALQKNKEAKALSKAQSERIKREQIEQERLARIKEEALAQQKREQQAKKQTLDNLISGVKSSSTAANDGEGPDALLGNKGQLDGSPYAPYQGIPGQGADGVGYGLTGRGTPSFALTRGCENEYGIVVVDIVVNKNGDVVDANAGTKGTTNITTCLRLEAEKIAKSFKWPKDKNAPIRQFGRVRINFSSH